MFSNSYFKKEYLGKLKPDWKFCWTSVQTDSVRNEFLKGPFKDSDFNTFLGTLNEDFKFVPADRPYKEVIVFLKKQNK